MWRSGARLWRPASPLRDEVRLQAGSGWAISLVFVSRRAAARSSRQDLKWYGPQRHRRSQRGTRARALRTDPRTHEPVSNWESWPLATPNRPSSRWTNPCIPAVAVDEVHGAIWQGRPGKCRDRFDDIPKFPFLTPHLLDTDLIHNQSTPRKAAAHSARNTRFPPRRQDLDS